MLTRFQMPKGALLHVHLDATVNVRVLLELALAHPAMHVRAASRLSMHSIRTTLPEFKALPAAELSPLKSITDDTYQGDQWISLSQARETFDASLGGPTGFDNWIVSALMINPVEAYETCNTTNKVHFVSILRCCVF